MSLTVNDKDLGLVTAYAYAVAGGYEGTEAEFEALLGNVATDLAEIENLTVTVSTLPAGSSATASYSNGVLSLGIPKGDKGDTGATGATGATGNGIASITKTGTSGNVDTYTITYTNGNSTTFTVTNGAVTSVAGKTGAVTLDADDVAYDPTDTYSSGTVGEAVSDLKSNFDQVEEPFALNNLSGNSKIAAQSFKAFIVHCEDPNATVKLMRVLKQSSNVYAIKFSVNGTNYSALNKAISSYTETAYNSFFINENLYGYYIIDWNALTAGTAYNNINAPLKQANIQPLDEVRKYADVKILLPTKIDTVVGREISIEFYNIINCSNVDEFRIDTTPNNAQFQNLHDRLKINTSSAGDTNVTITVYKNDVLITSKVVTVHSVANTIPAIKAIFIGDSMTASGYYLAELKNMMGDSLTLYGTRTSTAEDADGEIITINHEGRAGWSTSNYINNASLLNVPNAFYNNGFDFSYYIQNNPTFSDVTDVFILLGTNDGFGTNVEQRIQTITTSIKNYNSNIRVHCMLPPPPIKSGYAFGTRNYLNYLLFKQYMYNTANKYIGIYDGAQGFYIVPVNVNLNCYYDFPQTEVAVNSRNPQLIPVGDDSVHPSKYGYYRFSDIIYAHIIANCS